MKIGKIAAISCALIIAFFFFSTTSFCQERDADKYLEAGKRLYNEGRFEEALRQFVAALQSDPANGEITQYIDKTQMKIKELLEISRALVRDDKISVYGKEIKDVKIKPIYYDEELKVLAGNMTRLIEKTKGKAGEAGEDKVREGERRVEKGKGGEAREGERMLEEECKYKEDLERRKMEEEERKRFEEEKKRLEEERKEERIREEQRKTEELEKRKKLEDEAKRKEALERLKEGIKEEKIREGKGALRRQDLLAIGIIILLGLFLIIRITTKKRIEPHAAKTPPKMVKKEEEFEPRDLKKFLKKSVEEEDKDLFK